MIQGVCDIKLQLMPNNNHFFIAVNEELIIKKSRHLKGRRLKRQCMVNSELRPSSKIPIYSLKEVSIKVKEIDIKLPRKQY